jgi:hypothetical protein
MRLFLLPFAFSLALAPWPASSQPRDAQETPQPQAEETRGATPWQAQIYSGHMVWSEEDREAR